MLSQNFLQEEQVWTAHIDQLARLAHQRDLIDDFQASLLWYVLRLGLDLCLAGDSGAGLFVGAYKANELQSVSPHSKRILVLAIGMAETNDAGQCHLVLPVFLARIMSHGSEDRDIRRTLCLALSSVCPLHNFSNMNGKHVKQRTRVAYVSVE